jgi:hypothetical protein
MTKLVIRWAGIGMLGGAALLGIVRQEPAPQPNLIAATSTPRPEGTAPCTSTRSPSFAREGALLARGRRELSEGNSARAMDVLDRYEREFPHGDLAPEALLLRVELLRARGEKVRAVALANQFVASNPKSPYAALLRKLIGEAQPR